MWRFDSDYICFMSEEHHNSYAQISGDVNLTTFIYIHICISRDFLLVHIILLLVDRFES